MKPRINPQSVRQALLLGTICLAFASPAQANIYYWDNNDTTDGFGTAEGSTWGTDAFWTTDATGVASPSFTSLLTDDLNFGDSTSGLAAGTVAVNGSVSAQSITFGSASGSIVLSGGTNITLGGTGSVTVNNASNAISSVVAGTAGLTKLGTGTLTLSGANTYTGGTTVNSGSLIYEDTGDQSFGALDGLGTVSNASNSGTLSFTQAASTTYNIGTINNSTTTGATGAFTLNGGLNSVTTIAKVNGTSDSEVIFGGNATGTVTISSTLNTAGQTVSFNGGTTNLNGSGAYGSNFIVNGGTVNTVQSTGNGANFFNVVNLQVLSGTFNMRQLNGLRIGNTYGTGLANGAVNASIVQSGGISNYTNGGIQLGSKGTTAFVDTFAMSGGTINLIGGQNISVGTGTSGGGTSSFNFSGGKIVESGTISGAQGAGAQQSFVWTGGTLAAATYNATNLTSTQGEAVSASTNTLTNAGGILAPGDIGTGGKTVVTGNYSVTSADASYAVDLGSTTAATAFQSGAAFYDQTTVSGTVALGGNLSVTLRNGFMPANIDTFTIITGSGGVSGSFANVSGGKVTLGGGATFDVVTSGTTVVLSNYTAGLGGSNYSTWATTNGITGQPFGGDFDNDGISNGMEYALGKNPTTSSQPPGVFAGNTITFTKGAEAIANSDVSWIIETSTTLTAGSWTAEITQTAGNTTPTVSYTFTPGSAAKKFARLKVVQLP